MNERKIPLRNYIILSIILILTIVLVIYFYMWYSAYMENKLGTPIMDKYLTVINYNELDNYLIENKDAVIYISILNDENIRSFEKKFKSVIRDYSLIGSVLYLDLTSEFEDSSLYNQIMGEYDLDDVPSIVVIRDNIVYDVYNIKSSGYDIDSLITYFTSVGVIND